MKLLVALVALTALVCVHGLSDDISKKIEEQRKKADEVVKFCIEEVGFDAEKAKKLIFGDFSIRDEKAQCFVKCFFKKTGFMNEAGVPQKEIIISKLSQKSGVKYEKLDELIEKCIQQKGEDQCETAYKIFQCYWENKVTDATKRN